MLALNYFTKEHDPMQDYHRRMSEPAALSGPAVYDHHQLDTTFAFNPPARPYAGGLHRGASTPSLRDLRHHHFEYPPHHQEDHLRHRNSFYSDQRSGDDGSGFDEHEPVSPLHPTFKFSPADIVSPTSGLPYSPISENPYGPSPPGTGTSTSSSIAPSGLSAASSTAGGAPCSPSRSISQHLQRSLSTPNISDPTNMGIGIDRKTYSFVALPGNAVKKRPRRRYDEIERLYQCSWPDCHKSYGTLNHLNAHVTMQKHGSKRSPNEFKELRKQWRKSKKEQEAAALSMQRRDSFGGYSDHDGAGGYEYEDVYPTHHGVGSMYAAGHGHGAHPLSHHANRHGQPFLSQHLGVGAGAPHNPMHHGGASASARPHSSHHHPTPTSHHLNAHALTLSSAHGTSHHQQSGSAMHPHAHALGLQSSVTIGGGGVGQQSVLVDDINVRFSASTERDEFSAQAQADHGVSGSGLDPFEHHPHGDMSQAQSQGMGMGMSARERYAGGLPSSSSWTSNGNVHPHAHHSQLPQLTIGSTLPRIAHHHHQQQQPHSAPAGNIPTLLTPLPGYHPSSLLPSIHGHTHSGGLDESYELRSYEDDELENSSRPGTGHTSLSVCSQ